jgi:hypothetical protein
VVQVAFSTQVVGDIWIGLALGWERAAFESSRCEIDVLGILSLIFTDLIGYSSQTLRRAGKGE